MSRPELRVQIDQGVEFWGFESDGSLVGVMGLQRLSDVTLMRHAYVRSTYQGQGIGGRLLTHLRSLTADPILIGTWAEANWAIGFYEKHGFRLLEESEKNRLLRTYWTIPERQVETSVVLADPRFPRACSKRCGCDGGSGATAQD
jgi:N-acetylglutamate synthase-like GNAT family acetyltransferase